MIPTGCAECARRERKEWEALVAAQPQVEGPGFSDMHHQPDENPYTPERYVASLLAAVRKAQTHSIHPMIAHVVKRKRKRDVFKLAVWRLLEIFERDTGIDPKVNPYTYSEDGISGNACDFLLKALASDQSS